MITHEEYEALMSPEARELIEKLPDELQKEGKHTHQDCEHLLQQLPVQPVVKHRRTLGDQRSVYVVLRTGPVCFPR